MSLDALLDHQRWVDAVEACVDKGITERPPVDGVAYKAFAVHPPYRGNLLALAIAHRAADKFIVDVVKDDISVADAACVLRRYRISTVAGAVGDEADALAHAVAGVIHELRQQ